jgi:hypothetical protein
MGYDSGGMSMALEMKATATVVRGPQSWAYFYTVLCVLLTIEAGIIPPLSVLAFVAVAGVTIYLCMFSGWFQNKLILWKSMYENKAR